MPSLDPRLKKPRTTESAPEASLHPRRKRIQSVPFYLLLLPALLGMCQPGVDLSGKNQGRFYAAAGTVSLGKILKARRGGRLVNVYAWDKNPRIHIFDFPDLKSQGRALNRIAAFVEKKGVRGKILNDQKLRRYIRKTGSSPSVFYMAHDYRDRDLRRFFRKASARPGLLNREELTLRSELTRLGFLSSQGGKNGSAPILLSFARDISPEFRRMFLFHEIRHALYFDNARYRRICDVFWRKRMTEEDREIFRLILDAYNYDVKYGYLVRNEFQAFLLQKEVPAEEYLDGIQGRKQRRIIRKYRLENPNRLNLLRRALARDLKSFDSLFRLE